MTDTLSEEDPWGPGQGSTSLPQQNTEEQIWKPCTTHLQTYCRGKVIKTV